MEKPKKRNKADMGKYDSVLDDMAKAGYKSYFDDKWDDLSSDTIERALWKNTAKEMLKSVKFPKILHNMCRDLHLS